MNAIAWAIVLAACVLQPPRDPKQPGYTVDNVVDVLLYLGAVAMLVYWSFMG
jgi:hypothetical protein